METRLGGKLVVFGVVVGGTHTRLFGVFGCCCSPANSRDINCGDDSGAGGGGECVVDDDDGDTARLLMREGIEQTTMTTTTIRARHVHKYTLAHKRTHTRIHTDTRRAGASDQLHFDFVLDKQQPRATENIRKHFAHTRLCVLMRE